MGQTKGAAVVVPAGAVVVVGAAVEPEEQEAELGEVHLRVAGSKTEVPGQLVWYGMPPTQT